MTGPRAIAIVGPTAAGKSELGVELALALGGEVVNADSMQLYRGMDVGTAKLTLEQRRGTPHHLLDVLDVTEAASVAAYQRDARAAVADIQARGALPILVGGSGLYVRAVLDHLDFPGTDPDLRASLAAELAELGSPALHARLAERDPAAAAVILPTNGRRVVRALEVIELTGRPFAAQLPDPDPVPAVDAVRIGLDLDRSALHERIAQRVDRMWAEGLVDEVRGLEVRGLRTGPTASRAVGYRQVLQLLAGQLDDAAARGATVRATKDLARRQATWFRADPRVHWFAADQDGLLDAVLTRVTAPAG